MTIVHADVTEKLLTILRGRSHEPVGAESIARAVSVPTYVESIKSV